MEIYPDFKELLELFNAQKVEYIPANKKAAGRLQDLADAERIEGPTPDGV